MQQPLRARVRNGRLVLDEPTDLPEGEEVELVRADADDDDMEDDLSEDERKQLDEFIAVSFEQAKNGQLIDGTKCSRSSAPFDEHQVHASRRVRGGSEGEDGGGRTASRRPICSTTNSREPSLRSARIRPSVPSTRRSTRLSSESD